MIEANKIYSVKEIFLTLQGEGYNTGTPAVFCRFSGCNLWNGIEKDRKKERRDYDSSKLQYFSFQDGC